MSGQRNLHDGQYMHNNETNIGNQEEARTEETMETDALGDQSSPKTSVQPTSSKKDLERVEKPVTEDFNMASGNKVHVTVREDKDLDEFRIETTSFMFMERFECPWEKWCTPSTYSLLNWKFKVKDASDIPKKKEELDKILPVLRVDQEKLINPPEAEIQVTWIGHATMLVQMDGITILTDPVFREYCGPEVAQIMHLGYKRYRSAACQVSDIPHLDAVIISHDHFDHLDWKSAQKINKEFPDVKWFVGKNGGDLCPSKISTNITDMLWWDEARVTIKGKEFTFACTPAQHWCRRTAFDMNKRLWCSWVVRGPTKNFYFAGDTGYYQPVFQKIGEKYGPFSLAAIPIGCNEPRHIVKYQHVNPPEAVKIHQDIKSDQSVSIHWGTFHMTNEFYLSPPCDLENEMGEDRNKFISLQHGETWVVGADRKRPKFMDSKPGTSVDGAEGTGKSSTGNNEVV